MQIVCMGLRFLPSPTHTSNPTRVLPIQPLMSLIVKWSARRGKCLACLGTVTTFGTGTFPSIPDISISLDSTSISDQNGLHILMTAHGSQGPRLRDHAGNEPVKHSVADAFAQEEERLGELTGGISRLGPFGADRLDDGVGDDGGR